jgi:putative drug exporter of the RND superfamily
VIGSVSDRESRYLARFVSALASFVSGRRTKWAVLAIWLVAAFAMGSVGSKLADVTTDETASFLPG